MRHQSSLAGLATIVVAGAVAIAALSRPSCLWASLVFSLLVLSFVLACLGVAFRRDAGRAFWAGFLTCGGAYAALSMAPWFDTHISLRLITTALLDLAYPSIPPLADSNPMGGDAWKSWIGKPPDYSYAHPRVGFTLGVTDAFHKDRAFFTVITTDAFLIIGHSLFAMFFAFAGGVLARRWHEAGVQPDFRGTTMGISRRDQ